MMLQWTLKTLWLQRAATLASAGGVAGAFLLVILLEAIFLGESKQMLSFIENTAPDVWVMQDGVSNMHMATSFVWDWKVEEVAALPGVESVSSILYVNTAVNAGGRDWFAYVVGIEPDDPRAGPWAIAAGRAEPAPGEIILPQMFARATGISLGEQARIADTDFTIVGFSKGTFSMANSVAFVSAADLEDILNVGATVSYMLVDAAAGTSGEELTTRIEAEVEKVNALTQEEFIDSDFEMAMKMGVEIISFMTIIGSALAAAIIAFTTFVQVASLPRARGRQSHWGDQPLGLRERRLSESNRDGYRVFDRSHHRGRSDAGHRLARPRGHLPGIRNIIDAHGRDRAGRCDARGTRAGSVRRKCRSGLGVRGVVP